MFLQSLYLHNFRVYQEAFFEFCPHVNIIYGPNAQGKTSVLEAIHFLMTGHSFRTARSLDLIRIGAAHFYLEASFIKHGIKQKLKITYSAKTQQIIYNNTPYKTLSNLLGILHGSVITPDDIALIKAPPPIRRHFLDLQIAQVDPLYVHHLTRYNRAMRQRNTLLRAKKTITIESWEHEMAHAAAYITQKRIETTNDLTRRSELLYAFLSQESEKLQLKYKTILDVPIELKELQQHYLNQFQKQRNRELMIGYTLTGPHRDDLMISIGGKEVRFFASEGQQRTCITTLRLAEWQRLHTLTNDKPLMLIDDIGISLDNTRREKLFCYLKQLEQVFLTSTQEILIDRPKEEIHSIHINQQQPPIAS